MTALGMGREGGALLTSGVLLSLPLCGSVRVMYMFCCARGGRLPPAAAKADWGSPCAGGRVAARRRLRRPTPPKYNRGVQV